MSDSFEIIKEETHVEKKYMEWKIHNFLSIGDCYPKTRATSPFSFMDRMWSVEISSRHYGGTLISLFLFPEKVDPILSVTYTFGMKYLEREIRKVTETNIFDKEGFGHGTMRFYTVCDFKKLCKSASEVTFTVYCYLECRGTEKQFVANAGSQTSLCSITALSRDLEELLASERQSDVTIEVHNHEFKAHKSVLVARSSVFAAMFDHDMTEMNDSVVRIDDCDPDAFHNFLQCMYTGNLKYSSIDGLISLYTVADKYSVINLKETCVHFIIGELSVDTACFFLVLADKHNETELKSNVEEFLLKNMKKVVPTENWKSFMSEHSSMAQDILIKSFSVELNS